MILKGVSDIAYFICQILQQLAYLHHFEGYWYMVISEKIYMFHNRVANALGKTHGARVQTCPLKSFSKILLSKVMKMFVYPYCYG